MRTLSPPRPFGWGFFASFTFFAMIFPFLWNRDSSLRRIVRQGVTSVLESSFPDGAGYRGSVGGDVKMNGNPPAETTPVTSPGPEPWLRGTLTEIAAGPLVVLHALEL